MNQSRYDKKLEHILRTSARIFAEKSYHATSMRDISRESGVSLAGLYHYCTSKEELLFLIQDNCFRCVVERLEQRLNGEDDPLRRLQIFIENHLSFFASNMSEMKVLSHEAESLAGDLHANVSMRKDKYTKLARKILKDLQQQNRQTQIDLTVSTYALFGMMNWIYNWYDPRGKLTVAELAQTLTQLFLNGLLDSGASKTVAPSIAAMTEGVSVWRGQHSEVVSQS